METYRVVGERIARAVYRAARGAAYAGLASRPALTVARMLGVRPATIFMFHRFTDGGGEALGTDVTMLRTMLSQLRKQGVAFMRLRDLAQQVAARTPLERPTAVFTVDDGYADFADLAAPIFAGFDCTPTVFLVTEFTSGRQWCWWDRIDDAFLRSPLRGVSLRVDGHPFARPLGTSAERRAGAAQLVDALKWVNDRERLRIVDDIGALLEVEMSARPTAAYAPLGWDAVRRFERAGVDFAPHSLTHPMLSRLSDVAARTEIVQSWTDLRRELRDPAPVFGYPNGSLDSFGTREMAIVRDSGMLGAVAFRRAYVDPVACDVDDRFRLSRFPAPADPTTAGYLASGMAWER